MIDLLRSLNSFREDLCLIYLACVVSTDQPIIFDSLIKIIYSTQGDARDLRSVDRHNKIEPFLFHHSGCTALSTS